MTIDPGTEFHPTQSRLFLLRSSDIGSTKYMSIWQKGWQPVVFAQYSVTIFSLLISHPQLTMTAEHPQIDSGAVQDSEFHMWPSYLIWQQPKTLRHFCCLFFALLYNPWSTVRIFISSVVYSTQEFMKMWFISYFPNVSHRLLSACSGSVRYNLSLSKHAPTSRLFHCAGERFLWFTMYYLQAQ